MFEEIFERAPVALLLVDEGGHIKLANREAQTLFGYEPAELPGSPLERLLPEPDREGPTQAVRKDGRELPVEVRLTPIQHADGIFAMRSIVDLSAHVRAEERFRAAVEAAPNAMIMVDARGTIVLVNSQTEALFGYTRAELLGQRIELLVPNDMKERHPTFVKVYMAQPTPRPMGSGRDLYAQRKDGSRFPVEIGLHPISGPEGDYVISSVVDISERVRARERLMERNEELEQFAYRTSHDLRAPLLSMKGLAELIVEDLQAGNAGEAVANARKIDSLAERMSELVESILALARSDYVNEAPTEVDLARIVDSAREKHQFALRQREVDIRLVEAHSRPLRSQPTRISQVIDNLVSNGVKYADPQKAAHHVIVRSFSDAHRFHIQIEDNGVGIPQNRHGEVFGIFKRFHADKQAGSGLGLYLVKRHVQKLGGSIDFESSPEGTIFHIELPLRPADRPRPG